jgi:hypothetical protein
VVYPLLSVDHSNDEGDDEGDDTPMSQHQFGSVNPLLLHNIFQVPREEYIA